MNPVHSEERQFQELGYDSRLVAVTLVKVLSG